MPPKTIVLGDLHLVRDTSPAVIDDLLGLVSQQRGPRLVFAGDLFDLSADHPGAERRRALGGALSAQPRVVAALREHVDRGGELWLLSGNHDAALGDPSHALDLATQLELTGEARGRVRTSPWLLRDGDVHYEHGHLYDPATRPPTRWSPTCAAWACISSRSSSPLPAPSATSTPRTSFLRVLSFDLSFE